MPSRLFFCVEVIAAIINATIGALILLLIIKLVRGGGGWRGNFFSRSLVMPRKYSMVDSLKAKDKLENPKAHFD